jgi:prolyl-tRNA editing enzyme YbaK/EbsC (Cys-tRNA(Pro) deacylase)
VFELGVSEALRDLASVVDVGTISEIIGEQVRLASEWEFATAFSDCEAGAMPPFGNLYDVPMFVDGALGQNSGSCSTPGRTA